MSEQSGETAAPSFLPELEIDGPGPQRRWTVLIRLILLIPHFIVLYSLGIAASVVVVLAWFAGLFLARVPDWIADFLALFVGYEARVNAYLLLLVDRYPPFVTTTADYPVRTDIRPGVLNRWTVFFRIILIIPVAILVVLLAYGLWALVFFLWLAVLIVGRTPTPIFGANAAFLRFSFRVRAYFYLLTNDYPKRLFGDPVGDPAAQSGEETSTSGAAAVGGTRPLVLTAGGKTLLIVFIILGVLAVLGGVLGNIFMGPSMEYQPVYPEYGGY